MTYCKLLLSGFILTVFGAFSTLCAETVSDTVMVNGRCGIADYDGGRVLVAVATNEEAAEMPEQIVRNGTTWAVETTTLPVVALQHGELCPEEFRNGGMLLAEGNGTVREFHTQLRYRGTSALKYTKKNYAVKLTDAAGESLDASLLGMRSDNSWILDGMASDLSRMRNRVSTDLWLALSVRPYYASAEPAIVNGTHGKFVEVIVNNRYWGLYCLTEKVDRKQLKLKKTTADGTIRGTAYKAFAYDTLRDLTEVPDATSRTWQGWEAEYPDPNKDGLTDWEPLYSLAQLLAQPEGSAEVAEALERRVDLPLWIDYCLLMEMMHADDNAAKNMYVYFRNTADADRRACVCPWDMDATWGRTWDRKEVDAESNCNISTGVNFHICTSLPSGFDRQCQRWQELRRGGLQAAPILAMFDTYFTLFRESGAARRETMRWNGIDDVELNFEAEQAYIHDWTARRLEYLDGDYGIPSGIVSPTATDSATATVVYGTDGRRRKAPGSGIAIVGGRKVME